jgi:DNA ligase-1
MTSEALIQKDMKLGFPILYKYTNTGAIQQWHIIVEDDKFWTVEGQKGGKLTTSLPTVCTSKNVGKVNETTPREQAVAEANAKHLKKRESGYYLEHELVNEKKFFEPMLAKDAKESKDLTFKVRTFVQPKLDGLRCINQDGKLMSRNGKPYVACPHLEQSDTTFDGELYTHQYKDDFNKIVSLCKKQKPTPEELAESEAKVEMWVYDYPSHNGVFSERYKALMEYWSQNLDKFKGIKIVDTWEVKSWDEIKKYHEIFLGKGYEGTIIRLDLGPYENKRSKQLLKYKDFIDEEFKIIGAEEGTGGRTGTIGYFIMQHDKNPNQTFKSNVKGDFDYLKDLWKNHKKYIGKSATVKYFQRTPKQADGTGDVPRFPYVIKISREDYE